MGYAPYLDLVRDLLDGKETIATGMTGEVARVRAAAERAEAGAVVALVSSGDPGIYGMASLAIELSAAQGVSAPIEIVPGVSASAAAAARLGSPLSLDFACISLSDLLVPWETIRERLAAVAAADLVVGLYNPRSAKRVTQLSEAADIFRRHRAGKTPVGIGTSVGTPEERIVLSDLDRFLDEEIGMRSVVLIGNRSSKIVNGWFLTPRGYTV